MRKTLLLTVVVVLLASLMTGATDKTKVDVYEQDKLVKSVVFMIGQEHYFINNQAPGIKMDAKPFIEAGRIFVPVRYLSNALGVTNKYIKWESPGVKLDEPGFPVVELAVNSKQIKSDGRVKTMDVAPLLRQGRTYLPARWVAEALGYQVAWDSQNQVVLCWPQGAEKPDISNVIEHIKPQEPVTPVQPSPEPEIPEEDTRPFSGKPLNPDDYATYDGWAIPYEFKLPGASIMEITVEELRQRPIVMGSNNGKIIYNVDVQKDMVYVKQAASSLAPAVLIFAKGNDVSAQRANTLKKYSSNPFTHGYYVSYDTRPGTDTKIEDVTHIMLLYDNQALAIKNPLYKGGSS